jgi:SAM-dependent methyltransferase
MKLPYTHYWDSVLLHLDSENPVWRAHSDIVNRELCSRWIAGKTYDRALKTDLFDEAMGPGLHPMLNSVARCVAALDISWQVTKRARESGGALLCAAADVRQLPFKAESFDLVVCNSTLDHFEDFQDVETSLRELHRVLKPRAQLILTLDNLANPLIAIRNALPFAMLKRSGLVPYFVGASCGPTRLKRVLASTGFKLLEIDGILHVPRFFAVRAAHLAGRHGSIAVQRRLLHWMATFEAMARWPTRFLSAYYVAAFALRES